MSVKFVLSGDDKESPTYAFGVTPEDVARLVTGGFMAYDLASMGGPAIKIVLIYGETERAILGWIQKAAGIDDVVIPDPAPGTTEVVTIVREP